MPKSSKRARVQRTLEQDGVDTKVLLLWMVSMIPRQPVGKRELLRQARRYSKAAELIGAKSERSWQPLPTDYHHNILGEKELRAELKARAELRKALAKPKLRISETIFRCMAVDAVTLTTGSQHYEEVAALMTEAYTLARMPCTILAKSLQKMVHDHRLEKGSKLTIFSAEPYRRHLPPIRRLD